MRKSKLIFRYLFSTNPQNILISMRFSGQQTICVFCKLELLKSAIFLSTFSRDSLFFPLSLFLKSKVDGSKSLPNSLGSMSIGIRLTEFMYLFMSLILSVVEGRKKKYFGKICVQKSPGLVLYSMAIKYGCTKTIQNFHFMRALKNFTVLLAISVIKKALTFVATDSKIN